MRQTAPLLAAPTARFKPKAPEHGRHIYAYRHVQTNQVLYSLTRTLDGVRSLRQLPDNGANTPQATGRIRRDHWRPFFSVNFPSTTHGRAQGVDAFAQLRSWRKLHEEHWTPPASLARPYTAAQIAELKERLEQRGGAKKETAYDLIKREKKRVRKAEMMDQKANSVADLAAVLLAQEQVGALREPKQTRKRIAEMLRLSVEARLEGGFGAVEAEMRALQPYLDRHEGFRLEEGAKMGQRQARRRLYALERRRARMKFAAQAVAKAQEELRTKADLTLMETYILEAEREHQRKLNRREIRKQQHRLDGYEAALDPASIFSKLEGDSTATRETGVASAELPELLKDINAKLEQAQSADETEGASQADIATLQRNQQLCERALPAYERAKQVLEKETEDGRATIEKWVEQKRGYLDAALSAQAELDNPRPVKTRSVEEGEEQGESEQESQTSDPAPRRGPVEIPNFKDIELEPGDHDILPPFPPDPTPQEGVFSRRGLRTVRGIQKRASAPIFTMEGVTVKWDDILDSEFAEMWPQEVTHQSMGLVKWTAPKADDEAEPVSSVSQWRQQGLARAEEVKQKRREIVQRLTNAVVGAVEQGRGNPEERRRMRDAEHEGIRLKLPQTPPKRQAQSPKRKAQPG